MRSRLPRLLVAVALLAPSAHAGNDLRALACAEQPTVLQLPAGGRLTIRSDADGPAWFTVEEPGQRLRVERTSAEAVAHVGVPHRRGQHAVRLAPQQTLQIESASPDRNPLTIAVNVDCTDSPARRDAQAWFEHLAAATGRIALAMPDERVADLLAEFELLGQQARDPRERAFVLHARAQTLLFAGRRADSADAFALAEAAWLAAADNPRARVARVARIDDLQMLARHAEALALADAMPAEAARVDYFAARLRLSRCLTLRYLGRMAEALACFREGVANMAHLGETLDEISALQDMADVERFLGNPDEAERVAGRALQRANLPAMEVLRGRIRMTLADLALQRGDIATGLAGLDGALSEFAAGKAPRWEANALLKTAELYVAIGALAEAGEFVATALQRLSERDAPARVAAAKLVQARIDLQLGRIDRARRHVDSAVDTYTRLSMPADRDSAHLIRARLLLQIGDRAGAAAVVAARDTGQLLNRDAWQLLEAGLAAMQNQCGKALRILRGFDGKPLSVERELDRVQTRASCLAADGRLSAALQSLLDSAQRVAALARRVESPLLRQVIAGYIAPLRRSAFRLHANAHAGVPGSPEMLWQWLQLDEAARSGRTSAAASANASRFDAEVARELLPVPLPAGAKARPDAPRHLLGLLASRAEGDRAVLAKVPAGTTLAQLQQRLGDAVFVSYIEAGSNSRLLWISHDGVRLQTTSDGESLLAATEALNILASDRSASISAINAASLRLRDLLWPTAHGAAPAPSRLFVDASGPLARLPWSLLPWPGADAPMLTTTRVTIARVGEWQGATSSAAPEVAVYIAGQENNPALATLWNARTEPGLVEAGIRARGGTVHSVSANDRDALVAAFSRPWPWLHIAAHGGTLPSRIGYAGIWLESTGSEQQPRFVSWLEILARGSVNDLVVLNACQLAENGQASSAGLSFADAVSRAGARDVVAARWQVSDGATTLWVPAFYQAMGEGAGAAAALWQAQGRLQASRVFRHPFYWAAYVHYGRI